MEPIKEQTKEQNKEIANLKTYLLDYLQTTSYYNPNRKYANKFICRNPEHPEARPSMSYNPKNNTIHCFSCGATYSIIDLVIMDYELGDSSKPLKDRFKDSDTIAQACNKIKELFNIEGTTKRTPSFNYVKPEPIKENLEELAKKGVLGQPTREYLSSRGITDEELINKLKLKNRYGTNGDDKGYLMIPYNLNGTIEHLTERVISLGTTKDLKELPKELRYKHHGKMITYDPFNYLTANKERAIFITEGELDTISFYQTIKELKAQLPLNTGAIALGGTTNSKDFINRLDTLPEKDKLYFILALDNDERGQQAQRVLIDVLEDKGLNYTSFSYGTFKDANEMLQAKKDDFKALLLDTLVNIKELTKKAHTDHQIALNEEIKANRESYINKNSVLGYLNKFTEHRENPIKPSRTYFSELDKILNGGFREGLITIGAVSSLGKTSFILQLADQLAQSRQKDVLYFSLEMSQDELIAKSINRLMYLEANGYTQNIKTQTEILSSNSQLWNKEQQDLFNIALDDYKSFGDHLFIKEGVSDFGVKEIAKALDEHILSTNRTPIIIIDYLQILASQDNRLTDKQKIDNNIIALKQLSREKKTPIIVVSSLNRASYSQDVSLSSFKESGAIEYTSDIILGLKYNLNDAEREQLKQIRRDANGLPEDEKSKLIEDFYKSIRAKSPRDIKLTILKNRQGEKDKDIALYFYPRFNMFIEQHQSQDIFKELLGHSKSKSQEEFIELPF